ncbi:MAG: bile acid:sodium symporter [Ectothiorhodospiraceae bacterium]|nr:bile acid:sodium symporter [Ectothiorhodospiraceae bacterium]
MLSPTQEALLAIMMVIIMFGMGSSLTFKDFRIAMRHPQAIMIGFASQYLFMPLIAFTLATVLGLNTVQTVGLVLMGCVPGGTTSNIFAYFSRSLLSLSIMMTVCSTLAAVLMVPVILDFYTGDVDAQFRVPPGNVASLLFVLLIPTLIGMWLRRFNANAGAVSELLGGVLGLLVIIYLLVTWLPGGAPLLRETGWETYAAVIGLGLCGFVIGYWFARATGLNRVKARTVSLETGIQNGPLAVLIVVITFSGQLQVEMMAIPVLYSVFIVITSSFVTLYYRRRNRHDELLRDQAKIEPA